MENKHSDWLWATLIVAAAYLASKVVDKYDKYVIRKEERLAGKKKTSKPNGTEAAEAK